MKKCEDLNECVEKQYKNLLTKVNYRWIIGVLIGIILLILSYKFWDKKEPLQTLISVGSGLVSIALGIFAIIYAMTESIKTSNKEVKVDVILDKIEKQVETMGDVVKEINTNTNNSLNRIEDISKKLDDISKYDYKGFYSEVNSKAEEPPKTEEAINDEHSTKSASAEMAGTAIIRPKQKTIHKKYKKGDICFIDLGTKTASVLGGKRPVLIVQNTIINNFAPSLTVVPITSKVKDDTSIPTHVKFMLNGRMNTAIVEQLTTISADDIVDYMDTIDDDTLKKVDIALIFQFGIQK